MNLEISDHHEPIALFGSYLNRPKFLLIHVADCHVLFIEVQLLMTFQPFGFGSK